MNRQCVQEHQYWFLLGGAREELPRDRSRPGTGRTGSSFSKKEWEKMREKHFIMWENTRCLLEPQVALWGLPSAWWEVKLQKHGSSNASTQKAEGQPSGGRGWQKT